MSFRYLACCIIDTLSLTVIKAIFLDRIFKEQNIFGKALFWTLDTNEIPFGITFGIIPISSSLIPLESRVSTSSMEIRFWGFKPIYVNKVVKQLSISMRVPKWIIQLLKYYFLIGWCWETLNLPSSPWYCTNSYELHPLSDKYPKHHHLHWQK